MIALAADGSVRDGLSLLDQAIARGNGVVTVADVKDMLGLADRGQSLALCRQVLRGEIKPALETLAAMNLSGSDPVQILQDMCELVHLLTRGQVIPDFAADPSLPEYDSQLLTEVKDVKIPALARAWQILLKGINEVQMAPNPAQAAEMVLIRLAYASDLPLPSDLVKQLRDTGAVAVAGSPQSGRAAEQARPNKDSGGGGKTKLALGGGGSVIVASPVPQAEVLPEAMSFKEIVALFSEKREAGLYTLLYGQVHLVRCAKGLLELRVGKDAPANLAGRVGQCLTEWTGQRWVISLSDEAGDPTLLEEDKKVEAKRLIRAREHPLMQAVFTSFPNAKIIAMRQKGIAPTTSKDEDAAPETEDDTLINNNED
jgi:DNA polymerase-3 subunit gamma/tau